MWGKASKGLSGVQRLQSALEVGDLFGGGMGEHGGVGIGKNRERFEELANILKA